MAKKRNSQSAAVRFVPALKAVVICAFLGGSAIGYVWQKNQLIELGRGIRERENRLTVWKSANEKLAKQVITLRSPAYLERRLKEMNIPLVQPSQAQIWRVVETPLGEAAPRSGPLLADRNPGLAPGPK